MIELKNISKSFGNLRVLSDISLSVGTAEIVAIVGPSGAGKTTLLQIAGSLEAPDSGEITYDGTPLRALSPKKLAAFRNKNIGFIFQFHELLPEFTACENAALPAMLGGMPKREAMEKAAALLTSLGLGQRLTHRPSELSGGEKQRTAIARALINEPRIIMADEPTGSLDSKNRDEIQAIIAGLCATRGQTFLIVTHDPSLASIAHRTVFMRDGRIETITDRNTVHPAESPAGSIGECTPGSIIVAP